MASTAPIDFAVAFGIVMSCGFMGGEFAIYVDLLSCCSMIFIREAGVRNGANRLIKEPSRPMRNLVKFHFMFFVPNMPGARSFRNANSGCVSSPLTLILVCIGKDTW